MQKVIGFMIGILFGIGGMVTFNHFYQRSQPKAVPPVFNTRLYDLCLAHPWYVLNEYTPFNAIDLSCITQRSYMIGNDFNRAALIHDCHVVAAHTYPTVKQLTPVQRGKFTDYYQACLNAPIEWTEKYGIDDTCVPRSVLYRQGTTSLDNRLVDDYCQQKAITEAQSI